MAQTKILGSSNQGSIAPAEWAVDPMFLAARVALRPLDYSGVGRVLGFYRAVGQTTAAAPAGNSVLANMRYTDPSSFYVLLRLRVGVSVITAVTAQSTPPIIVSHARSYSVSETTNTTALVLTGNNQKMRTTPMGTSLVTQMGVSSAAAGISGGTKTVDANAFGAVVLSPALVAIGSGVPMTDLYKCDNHGGHPPVYAPNEGYVIAWSATALATGTVSVVVEHEWAEVIVF